MARDNGMILILQKTTDSRELTGHMAVTYV